MINQTPTSPSGPAPTSSASEAEFAEDQYFDALVAGDVLLCERDGRWRLASAQGTRIVAR